MSFIQDKIIKKLSPKHATLMLILLPVAMAALFVYFIYLPDARKISDLRAAVDKNQSEISKSQVMQRKLSELKAASLRLQEELKAATERLPSGEEESRLPDLVGALVKESGLTLKAWTPGEKKPGPGGLYNQTVINVELAGGYHDLGRFMEGIDKMTRMLAVSDLTMSGAKLDGKKMNIPVKFTITAFSSSGR